MSAPSSAPIASFALPVGGTCTRELRRMAPVRTITPTALSMPGSPRTVTPLATTPAPLRKMPDSKIPGWFSTRTRRFDTVLPGDWMSSEKLLLGERRIVPPVP